MDSSGDERTRTPKTVNQTAPVKVFQIDAFMSEFLDLCLHHGIDPEDEETDLIIHETIAALEWMLKGKAR